MEQILDKRVHRRKEQYLIKWRGYSDTHNSWEPKENIWAPELILAFKNQEGHKAHQKKHTGKEIAKLCPRSHVGAKIKQMEAPMDEGTTIRTLQLGQGEARSKDKALFLTHNTCHPTLPLPSTTASAGSSSISCQSTTPHSDCHQVSRSSHTPDCHFHYPTLLRGT